MMIDLYINILIASAIIGGLINLYQLISFIRQCKLRFLKSRNPILIIIYCIIALLTAFTTTPFGLYYDNSSSNNSNSIFFNKLATEFFNELCHAMLYVIILCRAWLLYYDYKFSECSSNQIWRNIIDPNDNNFWLTHRKTFGNLHFIICIALIITSLSLICLSFIGSIALKQENSIIFHYFTLFGLGIPFYSFLIYLIMYKIKLINDIYLIHRELKYLSLCIIVRIIAFIIDLIINSYDNYLFFYTIEVLSTFLSVWIQCQWVLNQLKKQENKNDLEQYDNFADDDNDNDNDKNKSLYLMIRMIDIFDDKTSFQVFMKHCIRELSVESVLFLIEICQFKATLDKFNVFGIQSIKWRYIDVVNTNFVKYIKQQKQADSVATPLYLAIGSDDDNNNNNNNNNNLSPSLISEASVSIQSKSSPDSEQNEQETVSINQSSTMITSIRQESEYKQFQQNILKKKWLPIAMPLKLLSNDSNITSKEITNTKTDISSNININIKPIDIIKDEEKDEEKEEDEKELIVDINWMFQYGQHLYLKYVDNSADLAINIPYMIRKNLWTVYSKESNVEAFQKIQSLHYQYLSQIDNDQQRLTSDEKLLFIQTYLYHSFDVAFHSIWKLLTSDTYHRFRRSKQFNILCQEKDIQKLEEARFKRDSEYSQSFQSNQSSV